MKFKDYFSKAASNYREYRPHYPEELFKYLATLVPKTAHVWDCGCGSGQATRELAKYFEKIDASDPSEEQLKRAYQATSITYHLWPAEKTELDDHSIDLITVGQAIHWFDLSRFYKEVKRVLKPGGYIAVWCYPLCSVNPQVDPILSKLYARLEWAKERKLIDTCYETLPFPFENKERLTFTMEEEWDLEQFLGYLSTWSASKEGANYASLFENVWREKQKVTWPIHMLVGK